MGRQQRDRQAEQAAISAAADRLLAGTPLRSSGKLTVFALITESGLRRDVVYEHTGLIEAFKARVRARQSTPLAMQQLAEQHAEAARQVAALKGELAAERAAGARLRKVIAELSAATSSSTAQRVPMTWRNPARWNAPATVVACASSSEARADSHTDKNASPHSGSRIADSWRAVSPRSESI